MFRGLPFDPAATMILKRLDRRRLFRAALPASSRALFSTPVRGVGVRTCGRCGSQHTVHLLFERLLDRLAGLALQCPFLGALHDVLHLALGAEGAIHNKFMGGSNLALVDDVCDLNDGLLVSDRVATADGERHMDQPVVDNSLHLDTTRTKMVSRCFAVGQ